MCVEEVMLILIPGNVEIIIFMHNYNGICQILSLNIVFLI